MVCIIIPEENNIVETLRNTLKNDPKSCKLIKIFIKKVEKLVIHSLYTCIKLIPIEWAFKTRFKMV